MSWVAAVAADPFQVKVETTSSIPPEINRFGEAILRAAVDDTITLVVDGEPIAGLRLNEHGGWDLGSWPDGEEWVAHRTIYQ